MYFFVIAGVILVILVIVYCVLWLIVKVIEWRDERSGWFWP